MASNVVALKPVKLPTYDAACRALEMAVKIDDVKHVLNIAEQIKLYGKQAADQQVIANGFRLQERALRRLGEVMAEQARTVGKATGEHGGRPPKNSGSAKPRVFEKPTLAEGGIDKSLARRARKRAAMPEKKFEKMLDDLGKPRPPPKPRRAMMHDVVDVSDDPSLSFDYDIEQAMRAAKDERKGLVVTDDILAKVRAVINAWKECLKRLEEGHGKK